MERLNKYKNDENFKAEHMAKFNKAWSDADANGDGRLDLNEHKAFEATMRAMKEADG